MVVHLAFIVVVAVGAVLAVRCDRLSWLHVPAVAEVLAPKAAPGRWRGEESSSFSPVRDPQASSSSSKRALTGSVPAEVLEMTVYVRWRAGSCVVMHDTPASKPSSMTADPDGFSQNPSP
jgi:hypothetical protein